MTQNHVPLRVGSSHATNNARGTSNTMKKRKSSSEDQDPDGKKKKTGNSRSVLDAHNHKHTKKNSNRNMTCGICFDSKADSDMFRGSSKCNQYHPFCSDCISKHVAAQIHKNAVRVNCPNSNCYVELMPEHLQPILPKQVFVQWESARCESSIDLWQKTYCPFKNCSVLLVNDGSEVVTSSECPSCHRLFCAQCKVPWHAGMNCKEFQKLNRGGDENDLDRKLVKLAKSEMWQRCPKCSIYVQGSSGCEHTVCRCGCNFCYCCGKDWKHGHACNRSWLLLRE